MKIRINIRMNMDIRIGNINKAGNKDKMKIRNDNGDKNK